MCRQTHLKTLLFWDVMWLTSLCFKTVISKYQFFSLCLYFSVFCIVVTACLKKLSQLIALCLYFHNINIILIFCSSEQYIWTLVDFSLKTVALHQEWKWENVRKMSSGQLFLKSYLLKLMKAVCLRRLNAKTELQADLIKPQFHIATDYLYSPWINLFGFEIYSMHFTFKLKNKNIVIIIWHILFIPFLFLHQYGV